MLRINNLSNDFINKIIKQAAGRVSQNILEDFLLQIEEEIKKSYYTNSSESNLLRIIQYQYDISFFINECLKYPHYIEILVTISNNSNYLSDILVRNPEYFFWIVNPSVLSEKITEKYYTDLLKTSLSKFKSFEAKINVIRNFKRKEILRIGLKDIFLKNDLQLITKYLSILAVVISKELFELCFNEILSKYDIKNIRNRYTVFSLGKLGGNELNYSSDIDLVAFYDKNSLINKKIYFNQILTETILLFIDTMSKKTGSGFLYRVDFRLRPDGRNSPLCASYSEYIRYYETRGEDWERQMLIKANFLCGSKSLFNKFYQYVSKFVYPASFITSPKEQIKKLKSSIEKRSNAESNIKLTQGGIRDIEFALQALQLLNGGKNLFVRTGNSLEAIKRLSKESIITENEKTILTKSYIFYRKIEHYLQLMNNQQTHTIPEDGEIAEKVAAYMEFEDLKSFGFYLKRRKDSVQNIFNSIVQIEISETTDNNFQKINFNDKSRAEKNIEFLRTGKSLLNKKQFDSRTINLFEKIENQIIDFLTTSTDPDLVIENFARIIKSDNYPHIWYSELSDKKFLNLFLQICEHSQKAIDLFAEDLSLRDEFLSRESLTPLENTDLQNLSLKSFLFRSSVQIVSKSLEPQLFPQLFSKFIRLKFSEIANEFASKKVWVNDFFIAGMGSLGTAQLSFNSDIDMIFVIKNLKGHNHLQSEFQKLLQTLKNNFPGFELDCRLRPEGKSSWLVWDIEDYIRYFDNRARVWELQAFTKCKFLYGNKDLYDKFMLHYINVVKKADKKKIKTEIAEMRKKLYPIDTNMFNVKKSPGSLMDIDFMVTYFVLLNPDLILKVENRNYYESELIFKDTKEMKFNYKQLFANFYFLKQLELQTQNIFNTRNSKIPSDEKKLYKLAKVIGYGNSELLLQKVNNISAKVRADFQNIFC